MGNTRSLACISQSTSLSWAAAAGIPPQTFTPFQEYRVCADYCPTEFYGARTIYNAGGTRTGVECTCFENQAKPTDIVAGDDSAGTCLPGDVGYHKTTTSFSDVYCTDVSAVTAPVANVPSISACFEQCRGFRGASVIFDATADNFQCFCEFSGDLDEGSQICEAGRTYSYEHLNYPQSSGLARRTRKERQEAQVQKRRFGRGGDMEYCPAGLSACRVGASDKHGYECLDTKFELESCGGCASGLFGSKGHASSSLGVNCATMSGTLLGGSTCEQGVCVAMACEDGYYLEDGACFVELD